MDDCVQIDTVIPAEMFGKRLDQVLVSILPEHSRARLQDWIRDGYVRVNSKSMRPSARVKGGEQLEIRATFKSQLEVLPEDIPLQIIFEDEYLIIINKPAGMVVHPGAGHSQHTLVQALLHHEQRLERVPRAGIVHRLDKETTGLLVVARTPQSHTYLVKQLQAHDIQRQYIALVTGVMIAGGTIDQAVGRDPKHRTKMAVVRNGRAAKTHYRIIKKYRYHTQLRVNLETGRTHQIRVHMAWLRHSIIGDPAYGCNSHLLKGVPANLASIITAFPRQALHAHTIGLLHPRSKELMEWQAAIPEDIAKLIGELEQDAQLVNSGLD